MARKLGRARDLDVQRELLESWAAAPVRGQGFAMHAVAAQWAAARQKKTPKLGRAVREFRRAETLSRMERALAEAGKEGAYGKKHFHRRAVKKLAQCLSRVRQTSLPADDTALLHHLRSGFRKLRYTLEICRPLDPGPIDTLIEQTHQFQDVLGQLHDVDMLKSRLSTRGKVKAVTADTRQYLLQRCEQEHRRLYRKFERLWREWEKRDIERRGMML